MSSMVLLPTPSSPLISSEKTYRSERGSAEAGASVEPIIVAQLVDLDAPLVLRLMRHVLCHHQRLFVLLQEGAELC